MNSLRFNSLYDIDDALSNGQITSMFSAASQRTVKTASKGSLVRTNRVSNFTGSNKGI